MNRLRIVALSAFLLSLSLTATASPIKGYALPELYQRSDSVVLGRVVSAHSFWNEAGDTIYTDYSLSVSVMFKGIESESPVDGKNVRITVRLMGGAVGDRVLTVSSNATLETGEEVFLCLRRNDGFHTVVGMHQGKWSVRVLDGVKYAFRGKWLRDLPRQMGEQPLDMLLKLMRGGQDHE